MTPGNGVDQRLGRQIGHHRGQPVRLGQVVIGALVKTVHPILHRSRGGQHQHPGPASVLNAESAIYPHRWTTPAGDTIPRLSPGSTTWVSTRSDRVTSEVDREALGRAVEIGLEDLSGSCHPYRHCVPVYAEFHGRRGG